MDLFKRVMLIMLTFFATHTLYSQFSVYVTAGAMNYGGDLQDKKFTANQAKAAVGIGVSYKFLKYYAVSYSLTAGRIGASDSKSTSYSRIKRNLNFVSNIGEASLTVEANLMEVPQTSDFTPYVFTGISLFHFNPFTYDSSGNKTYLEPLKTEGQGLIDYPGRKTYSLTQVAIPLGAGIKYAISDNITIGAEFCFRKAFTDYLDDVSNNTYANPAILNSKVSSLAAQLSYRGDELNPPIPFDENLRRGNPDKKDAYYSFVLKVNYSLDKFGLFKY